MKKDKFLFSAMLAVMLAFGFFLVSCGDDSGGSDTGKLVITNTSDMYYIRYVEIYEGRQQVQSYSGAPVGAGKTVEFSLPPGPYDVHLTDDAGDAFDAFVTIRVGETKYLVYNGWDLH